MKCLDTLLKRSSITSCRCASDGPADGRPNPAFDHLPWEKLSKMIKETELTKDEERLMQRYRDWPADKTIQIQQKFCYYRKLYLNCESDPSRSLVVHYDDNNKVTFYEDQLIGTLYAILWGLHTGQQLIKIVNSKLEVCDYLRKSKTPPAKSPEIVLLLRSLLNPTIDNPPFQVRLMHKDYDLGFKDKPPYTPFFFKESVFLDTTMPAWDLIKQVTEKGFDDIPALEKRFAKAKASSKKSLVNF
ncbi:unnamed protein product, partial [Mesorhabditis belari]|uniref:Uncharacterized protein n=1 Tax=Mesorhabditis belari TaxID=2138241 RepID=A0AAF3ELS6_9BILA